MYVRASIFYLDTEKQSCVRFNIHPNLSCHCTSHGWCANVWATIFFFSSHNGIATYEWQLSLHSVIIWRAVRMYNRHTAELPIDVKSVIFFQTSKKHMISENNNIRVRYIDNTYLKNTGSLTIQSNIFIYIKFMLCIDFIILIPFPGKIYLFLSYRYRYLGIKYC